MFRKHYSALIVALVSSALIPVAQPASAQNLLDVLFGRPKRVERAFPPPPPPPTRQQKAALAKKKVAKAAPAKIESPTYLTYKADNLVRVDFSKLLTTAAVGEAAMQAAPASFAQNLAGEANLNVMAERPVSQAVLDWYSAHPAPLWTDAGKPNAKAKEAERVLADAAAQGLNPEDYAVETPTSVGDASAIEADALRYETELTARVLRYASDARGGRIDPNRISGYYDFPAKPVDFKALLTQIEASPSVTALLEAENPDSREYRLLRDELAALESQSENEIIVDSKLLLKPGETSPEFPKLVQFVARGLDDDLGGQFGEALYKSGTSEIYDADLVPLFKALQEREGLKPDGVIGPRTVQALAGQSKAERIRKIQVAMEQIRWLPRELGETRVFINQPAFTAAYYENGQEKLSMRTVIGKTTNQTSFFYDVIKQVDFNPYWGVPQSILVNEMLPRLRRDPGYLDRSGYEVFNSKGKKVPSSSVSWGSYGAKIPFSVRQTPSEANALGELKILFPNKHAIYMHDTPQKAFFNRDQRALSHGCVRLAQPREMAAAVLGKPLSHVEAKLSQGHSMERVTRTIPVYVAYFTAWPNKDGVIEYFGDVYDRDARLFEAIDKTEEVRSPSV